MVAQGETRASSVAVAETPISQTHLGCRTDISIQRTAQTDLRDGNFSAGFHQNCLLASNFCQSLLAKINMLLASG